ncbi:hypothetical protein FRACA_100001 [Frankia canadensis]|uniref:Uncharacterized protein n=1 Tax=Frankia canadensis TaxID=1836972 RepID=A0A2I2KIE7_9ACTN|nr:hypothetical protein FRACA_100001 [Frankia canadensis]SOU52723.1 hypothetical protein FRACA_100001 [Frankia canadensis]
MPDTGASTPVRPDEDAAPGETEAPVVGRAGRAGGVVGVVDGLASVRRRPRAFARSVWDWP